jgi:hypothetical protein
MDKDIKVIEKEIKKLKKINRILIIYVVLSIIVMLYNAFFLK